MAVSVTLDDLCATGDMVKVRDHIDTHFGIDTKTPTWFRRVQSINDPDLDKSFLHACLRGQSDVVNLLLYLVPRKTIIRTLITMLGHGDLTIMHTLMTKLKSNGAVQVAKYAIERRCDDILYDLITLINPLDAGSLLELAVDQRHVEAVRILVRKCNAIDIDFSLIRPIKTADVSLVAILMDGATMEGMFSALEYTIVYETCSPVHTDMGPILRLLFERIDTVDIYEFLIFSTARGASVAQNMCLEVLNVRNNMPTYAIQPFGNQGQKIEGTMDDQEQKKVEEEIEFQEW